MMLHRYWWLYYSYYNWKFLENISNDFEAWYDTSNYDENEIKK